MSWKEVSILILLDSLLLFQDLKSVARKTLKFQSLFYWILFFYNKINTVTSKFLTGFNPYSTGFYSLIEFMENLNWKILMFQSLFYWILFSYKKFQSLLRTSAKVSILILLDSILLYREDGIFVTALISFNPYSTGFYSFIVMNASFITELLMFQSLFYWILFFYPFYRADSLFSTLIEFFWESNSIKINRYVTRFYCFFTCFRNFFISQFLYFSYFASKKNYNQNIKIG